MAEDVYGKFLPAGYVRERAFAPNTRDQYLPHGFERTDDSLAEGDSNLTRTFNILAMGQSNIFLDAAYTYDYPSNVTILNNDPDDETSVGTQFVAVTSHTVGIVKSFAAHMALDRPNYDVRITRVAAGGKSIDKWIGGMRYKWSTDTTATRPADGYVKINNAAPASLTRIYTSIFDREGVNKGLPVLSYSLGTYVKIYAEADPTRFIIMNPSADVPATTIHGSGTVGDTTDDWQETIITYRSSAGTLINNEDVRLQVGPDMYSMTAANAEVALTLTAAEKFDVVIWWQGEGDAGDMSAYGSRGEDDELPGDFDLMQQRFIDLDIIDETTPWLICGTADGTITGNSAYDGVVTELQNLAQMKPESRAFYPPSVIDADLWDTVTPVHMVGEGYYLAGRGLYNLWSGASGRGTVPGAAVDYGTDIANWTGYVYAPGGNTSFPGVTVGTARTGLWNNEDISTGLSFLGIQFLSFARGEDSGILTISNAGASTVRNVSDGGIAVFEGRSFTGSNAIGPALSLSHARGTSVAQTALLSNDILGQINFNGAFNDEEGFFATGAILRANLKQNAEGNVDDEPTKFGTSLSLLLAGTDEGSVSVAYTWDKNDGWSYNNGTSNLTIVDGSHHIRLKVYTRATLPTATGSNLGLARVSNPEAGFGRVVLNAGSDWRYTKDDTAVTIGP